MSTLKVNNIAGVSGGTSPPITLSGDTATLSGTGVTFPAGGTGNPISVAVIVDQKANNTEGGTFTSGDWRIRDLNTEISDPDGIVSVSSNQFTLGAGTYLISWSAPAFVTAIHVSKLYSVTDSSDLRIGTSEYSNSSHGTHTHSKGHFVHTISASHVYEIRHRCSTTRSINGFGSGAAFGVVNIFTEVLIQKLK